LLHPSVVKLGRRSLVAASAAAAGTAALRAVAQSVGSPSLVAPDASTRAALRELAGQGAVVLVRDLDAGANARVTVLCRVAAPLDEVRAVIAAPERYGDFVSILRDIAIDSRRGAQVGFRFRATASIFDLETSASLRVVNARRIDVAIVRSDLGPGAARWELFDDPAGGTLVSCTSWGDPSRGHWLFRQIASRGGAATAMMTAAVGLMLSLSLVRRVRRVTGALPRANGPVSLTPLSLAARALVPEGGALGAVTLRADGLVEQASACVLAPGTVSDVAHWLEDPTRYPQVWRSLRNVRVLRRDAAETRFSSEIDASVVRSAGTRVLTLQRDAASMTARWIGVDGDERGHEQRWDASPLSSDRVAICATVGDQVSRIGFPLRATLDREPALRAGFAFGLGVVWARSLAKRLARDREASQGSDGGVGATTPAIRAVLR
jgi:hypothetical protein